MTDHDRRSGGNSRRYLFAALGVALLMIAVVAPTATAADSAWEAIREVDDAEGYPADGGALARTVSGGTTYLHAVWRGTARGTRIHTGPQYYRSADNGSTWTKRKQLADVDVIGEPHVAGAGSNLYVAWTRALSTGNAIYFRRNTTHGNLSSWRNAVRLSSTSALVDEPSIAAAGSAVYIAYANLGEGTIRLVLSRDRGTTWIRKTLATVTTPIPEFDRWARPIVAAFDTTVAVFWLLASGQALGRVSTDQGRHWGSTTTLGDGLSSAAANKEIVAVAGSDHGDAWIRVWNGAEWGPQRFLPDHALGPNPDVGQLEPMVAVPGCCGMVGVAYLARDDTADVREQFVWAFYDSSWRGDEPLSQEFIDYVPTAVHDLSVTWRSDGRIWVLWRQAREDDPHTAFGLMTRHRP